MTGGPALSDATRSVWGKSDRNSLIPGAWLPLWRHLDDTAGVAGRLWDGWLSPAVRQMVADQLPGGDADGRTLAAWLGGIHDIGKATPAFASQEPRLSARMRDRGLTYNEGLVQSNRRQARHDTAGHLVLAAWLGDLGWTNPDPFAVVVGGHHGMPPGEGALLDANRPYLLGDDAWIAVQRELLLWMSEVSGAADRLGDWCDLPLTQPAQAALTGLVIVADWIASNEENFPYLDLTGGDRLETGWNRVGLPQPWVPMPPPTETDELFAARFDLPPGAAPRPVQHAAVDLASTMPVPGMMIIEAAMGEGKTEAALAAVEILAARGNRSGCYFALPTRATSDAMFTRLLSWLSRLPDARTGRGPRDVLLAHGKAAFNQEYAQLRRSVIPSGIGVDSGGTDLTVHTWLAGRKRTMLSSFVVGTIDQLLFAALRSRHLVLRHLGLAGKVVVIDEAHAYDIFMGTFLDRALTWLGAYGVPVIVLSATLPARRRAELMKAYDDGRLGRRTRQERRAQTVDLYAECRTDMRYPLITVSALGRGTTAESARPSGRGAGVEVRRLDDDPVALEHLLRDRLADGGCALVVRNTVTRVQQTAAALRDVFGDEIPVTVAHSRFMAIDRAAKDRWLRETFGPPGTGSRPERHIVVASQVAEQSLDIDFDLLVTDLAPVDLILQRLGRLHRHDRGTRPDRVATPACWITGADWSAAPPVPDSGSRRIYHPYPLLRSAAVLGPHLDGVPLRLPDDIAPLTQTAYGTDPVGPPDWQPALEQARARYDDDQAAKELEARGYRLDEVAAPGTALIGWLDGPADASDDRAAQGHVRDTDGDSIEVILLVRTPDGLVLPPWIDHGGEPVPTGDVPQWPVRIARCTLPLPQMMTAPDVADEVIADLEQRIDLTAWQKDHWLAGELVLDVDSDGRARVGPFDLHYDAQDGLRAVRT